MGVRKSTRSLTTAERSAFVSAVKALKAQTGGRNYDWFVDIHMKYFSAINGVRYAHHGPSFLPWHRQYLIEFEKALQAASRNPAVTVPYWDWTVDRSPDATPFTADFMGGNGVNGPVTTGPFAGETNWRITVSSTTSRSLRRAIGGATLPSATQVNTVLGYSTYDASPWSTSTTSGMRNRLEGWLAPNIHNSVHVWVGGHMAQQDSPNDPLFWLHHCNIDRLWSKWQARWGYGTNRYLPAGNTSAAVDLYETMLPWSGVTPAAVLDHRTKYTYA